VVATKVEQPVDPKATYFEQLDCNGLWLKLGDAVYLRGQQQLPDIVRVDKLWRKNKYIYTWEKCTFLTKSHVFWRFSNIFLSGIWFARPQDVDLDPERLCYKKELFAAKRIDSASISGVLSKCYVMSHEDYKNSIYN